MRSNAIIYIINIRIFICHQILICW